MGLLALGVGALIFQMGKGLDTSKPAPAQKPIQKTGDSSVDNLVDKGQEMLAQIRKENTRIPDEALSAQIEQLDAVARKILQTVTEKPSTAPIIRRSMEYYLPTTLKMLEGFHRMEERQVSGDSAEATRAQIRSAMDTIIAAFDKQLAQLYHDDMLDISTDIDVLEMMLHQDGLTDTGISDQKMQTMAEE